MYSTPKLFIKYLQYYFTAANGNGHGVHSPFVYTFIKEVLNKKNTPVFPSSIEAYRTHLLSNRELVEVWDRGAGSRQNNNSKRTVSAIAKAALKPQKYSRLLGSLVNYFKPATVLEMGTSLGITTSYLAAAYPLGKVVTMEGAPNVAKHARANFAHLGIENVELIEGDFDMSLPVYLDSITNIGFAYVDGNHKYEPTMRYFNCLKVKSNEASVLVFDDIHWSAEMEKAWTEIKNDKLVTLTIDLFFIGLVFFRKAQKEKENFIIRY